MSGAPPGTGEAARSAIIVAGGAGSRLGGADKPGLIVRGSSLLALAVNAATGAGCETIVVVGPPRELPGSDRVRVRWVQEEPPGSGPAWAVRAALPVITTPRVLLLAADLPRAPEAVQVLLQDDHDAAALVADQRIQWLLGSYPTGLLRSAAELLKPGASMRTLLAPLHPTLVPVDAALVADVDTWEDLADARRFHE